MNKNVRFPRLQSDIKSFCTRKKAKDKDNFKYGQTTSGKSSTCLYWINKIKYNFRDDKKRTEKVKINVQEYGGYLHMPEKRTNRKVSKPKKQKVKQGHKLVWLTLIILIIPVVVVGYVLLTSASESDQPVVGNRFDPQDLNPKIQETEINSIQGELMSIGGMETATVTLKSATLRIHLNMVDSADNATLQAAADQAYQIVSNHLPIETYFTNTAEGKNYDLEIDSYNYLVDDTHPQEGWRFIKVSKSGAGQKVTDIITEPRNAELAQQVRTSTPQATTDTPPAEEAQEPLPEEVVE